MAHYTSEHTGVEIDLAVESANLMLLTGAADPATSTVGTLGQIYQNTTDGTLFRCTNIAGEIYTWTEWADYSLTEKAKVTAAIPTTSIVNDLTTGGTGVPLSAEQGKTLKGEVGTLASLTTTEKGSLVGAINEVDGHADTNTTNIGDLAYTENNYITDSEPLTESVDKLDMAVKDNADLISSNTGNVNYLLNYVKSYSTDGRIFGVSWDKGETPTLTRTDSAVGLSAEIGIDDAVVSNDFDFLPIFGEISKVTDSLGNVYSRIPKFYSRKTDGANLKTWQVSKTKYKGFYLPWCFWDFTNSRELPYIDVGCYNASLDGTKLASKSGTYPLVNTNIVAFRGYAQANNAGGLLGYQQMDIHVVDVLRTLFFIEFGTLNSQAIMQGFTAGQYAATHLATATEAGANRIVVANAHADLYRVGQAISVGTTQGGNQKFYGRTITGITVVDESNKAIEFDGDPVDIATGNLLYNTGWKSGFSSSITASSGCIGANDGKYPCSYRGIENPFGSVWQFVDGVNITDNQAWVCKDAGQYASNVFASPYEKLSYVNLNANGNGPVEMGYDTDLPFAEFATSVTGGSTSKYYCDYYYQDSGSRIALFGGNWSNGLNAGLSYWRLSSRSSSPNFDVGGRLVRKAL